ncbi:MAG: tryptophan synthase subunit alpha [Gammaproteobacteria bacterium]|nr:tryptophan synthase subunit alpha [Gammaproteobacteria bacterium]
MSRLKQVTAAAAAQDRKLLIPYLVAGDPDLACTLRLMHKLVANGADIIELGIPFSDPSSDGPVIQEAAERALAGGTTLRLALDTVAQFRQQDRLTPVVLMGYLNPIEILGYETFARAAAEVEVDGVLVVDMPATEAGDLTTLLRRRDIDTIYLIAPTTRAARAKTIAAQASGYLYYVSLKGVTGAVLTDHASVRKNIEYLRELTDLPIVIGFGIKDAESAAAMAALADGVIIGSALVSAIKLLGGNSAKSEQQLETTVAVIRSARAALDRLKRT